MEEELKLFRQSAQFVERLNRKYPASSFALAKDFKDEINKGNTQIQHQALIKLWARELPKKINEPPSVRKELEKFILEWQKDSFPFGIGKSYSYPLVKSALLKEFQEKAGGEKRATEILRKLELAYFNHIADGANSSGVVLGARMNHTLHLIFHTATSFGRALNNLMSDLTEDNRGR